MAAVAAVRETVAVTADGGARFVSARSRRWVSAGATAPATIFAPRTAAATTPLIDLGGDELDGPTPVHIVRATADALDRGETHYTPRPGILPLRQSIARTLAAAGHPAYDVASEVLVANGSQEGLYVAIQMLVRPGDEVLLADPGPAMLREAVRFAGGVAVLVPLSPVNGWGLTADAVRSAITPRTRLLVVASPDSATGGVTTRTEWEAIAALAVEHDLRVLADESNIVLRFVDEPYLPLAALPGMYERTITVGSFSRTYTMSGYRVGYVVGEAHLLHAITDLKLALSICSAAPCQWAAVAALDGPQECVDELRAEIAARRTVLLSALATMGLQTHGSSGGLHLLAGITTTGLVSAECASVFVERASVRVVSGSDFGPVGEGYVRFSLTRPVSAIETAIARLAPLVATLQADAARNANTENGGAG